MIAPRIQDLRNRLEPLRRSLLDHPVYRRVEGVEELRRFMEIHAFAVWDFMSLLKALQRRVCRVDLPWTPPEDPLACRLVNEIVLGEESDEDGRGSYSSHFELYRRAMIESGADTGPVDRLVEAIRGGGDLRAALEAPEIPEPARHFVRSTFEVIDGGDPVAIASAFTFGREDLLPDVFRRIIDRSSGSRFAVFRYYLDRHIEVDGGEHGPMAWHLVDRLCGDDPGRWAVAEEAASRSLRARAALWDGVLGRLEAVGA